ncbi:fibronectin type III domain-containing protein [Candidatus Uhrbacteria bacterium]|nr:fibronectin type III domain-containing protein [Candidatus Uhrbacteria bacterium]
MAEAPLLNVQSSQTVTTEPEIHVIPEAFYGAALKAKIPDPTKKTEGLTHPPARHGVFIVIGVLVLFLIAGGVGVYFFRDTLFPKPVIQPPVTQKPPDVPPPVVAPEAPTNLTVTSTNPQTASLMWVDNASSESGFRIERAENDGTFVDLTSLPPNSTSYIDASVQAGKNYRYRVSARNSGGESPVTIEVAVTIQSLPPPAPPAPKLPPAGLDTDSDGLTDLEEALLHSDPKNPDTDNDGFLDGNEAFHLYNPNGRAPARLLDAKLVKQVDASIGYSFQLPNDWIFTLTIKDGSKASVKTAGKEHFEISVEDNPKQLAILDWYLQKNPNVKAEHVLKYRTKRGYEGIIGADLLTRYLPWGDKIFVFNYVLEGEPFINYQTLFSLMMNSLELRGLPQLAPNVVSAEPLPFEPAATTTGVISQPEAVTSTEPAATTTSVISQPEAVNFTTSTESGSVSP